MLVYGLLLMSKLMTQWCINKSSNKKKHPVRVVFIPLHHQYNKQRYRFIIVLLLFIYII